MLEHAPFIYFNSLNAAYAKLKLVQSPDHYTMKYENKLGDEGLYSNVTNLECRNSGLFLPLPDSCIALSQLLAMLLFLSSQVMLRLLQRKKCYENLCTRNTHAMFEPQLHTY